MFEKTRDRYIQTSCIHIFLENLLDQLRQFRPHNMHFLKTTIVFTTALGLPLAHAVNLNLFWSIFDNGCDHTEPYASCTNINSDVCCVYSSFFYSAEGTGLDTTGVPAVVSEFQPL
jgi:hypothetical protein